MEGLKLKGSAELINEKAKFRCTVEGKQDITVDYIPPLGDGEGHTSLELLLLSLSSCFATSVKFMLAREKITVDKLKVNAEGERKDEHPTAFKSISLFITIKGKGLTEETLEKVIRVSEESICPVYAMIKGFCPIEVKYKIKNNTEKIKAGSIHADKKTDSYCGVFCPSCTLYIGTKEEPERLLMLSERMGKTVEEIKCTGCRSDKVSYYCRDCGLKKCAEKGGYESCADCPDYPCRDLEKFQTEMPHRAELWKSLEIIRDMGRSKWTELQASDYACPQCNVINSAYDLRCRNCGSEPGSRFAEKYRDKITAHLMKK
jgi:uncharacterized OsmC-like protein